MYLYERPSIILLSTFSPMNKTVIAFLPPCPHFYNKINILCYAVMSIQLNYDMIGILTDIQFGYFGVYILIDI